MQFCFIFVGLLSVTKLLYYYFARTNHEIINCSTKRRSARAHSRKLLSSITDSSEIGHAKKLIESFCIIYSISCQTEFTLRNFISLRRRRVKIQSNLLRPYISRQSPYISYLRQDFMILTRFGSTSTTISS